MKTIDYYLDSQGRNPVKEFINSLPVRARAKIRRVLLLLEEYGLSSVIPHIRKISGSDLWEIRILGKDNIRILYVILDRGAILALHGFIKKTMKTPRRELNKAMNRYMDWVTRNSQT